MDENELLELNADLMVVIREKQEEGALDDAIALQILLHKNLMRLRQFLSAPEQPLPEAPKDWQPPMPRPRTPEPADESRSDEGQIEVPTPSPPRPEVPRKRPADLLGTLNDTHDDDSGKYSSTNKGKRRANREPKRNEELGRVSSPAVAAPPPTLAPALPGTSPYLNSVGASASRWQGGLPFPPQNLARAAGGIASPYVGLPGMIGPAPCANINQSCNGISGSFSSGIRPLPFPAAPNFHVQGPPPFFPVGGSNFWPTHWPHTNIPAALGSAAANTRNVDIGQVDRAPEPPAQQATSSPPTSPQSDDGLEIIVDDDQVQISSNGDGWQNLGAPAERAILAQPWMQSNTGERRGNSKSSSNSAMPLDQDSAASNDDFNVFDPG